MQLPGDSAGGVFSFEYTQIGPVGSFVRWGQINSVSAVAPEDGVFFATMVDESRTPNLVSIVGTDISTGLPDYVIASPVELGVIDLTWHAV